MDRSGSIFSVVRSTTKTTKRLVRSLVDRSRNGLPRHLYLTLALLELSASGLSLARFRLALLVLHFLVPMPPFPPSMLRLSLFFHLVPLSLLAALPFYYRRWGKIANLLLSHSFFSFSHLFLSFFYSIFLILSAGTLNFIFFKNLKSRWKFLRNIIKFKFRLIQKLDE